MAAPRRDPAREQLRVAHAEAVAQEEPAERAVLEAVADDDELALGEEAGGGGGALERGDVERGACGAAAPDTLAGSGRERAGERAGGWCRGSWPRRAAGIAAGAPSSPAPPRTSTIAPSGREVASRTNVERGERGRRVGIRTRLG